MTFALRTTTGYVNRRATSLRTPQIELSIDGEKDAVNEAFEAVPVPASVTVCVTSCGRLDLLKVTLDSFCRYNTGARFLVSEDSTDMAVIEAVTELVKPHRVLSGPERLGLMGSIDRLYAAVDTAHIFHLEDDWKFDGPINWMAAISLLDSDPKISNVCVRDFSEIKPKYGACSDEVTHNGAKFRVMHQNAHAEFFGWSSNPGLIRHDLYRRYAPFTRYMHDQMSGLMKKDGLVMAYLLPGVAGHTGRGRNVTDPTMPARPTSRPLKWLRAFKKKLYYMGLRREPF